MVLFYSRLNANRLKHNISASVVYFDEHDEALQSDNLLSPTARASAAETRKGVV